MHGGRLSRSQSIASSVAAERSASPRRRSQSRHSLRGLHYEEIREVHEFPLKYPLAEIDKFEGRTDFVEPISMLAAQYAREPGVEEFETHLSEKIILLGSAGVGKSCLAIRFTDDIFHEDYAATIGAHFYSRKYKILRCSFVANCWDTAGQERFRALSTSYFRQARVCCICFDLSLQSSLDAAREIWFPLLQKEAPACDIFLVGLKADLPHLVGAADALSAAKLMDAEYWQVSAKTGENVAELFDRVAVFLFEGCLLRHYADQAVAYLKPNSALYRKLGFANRPPAAAATTATAVDVSSPPPGNGQSSASEKGKRSGSGCCK